ncbi:hypothetical protein [Streptomyces sp. RLB1-9]|uniref:hypothetical protein n=1 Tax=Streptomyces sp. RLB1-9 TaxID=2594454 RepID=UPI001967A3B4|nr:hypothetical protein [Streptomyces sp. RLB1-9]
MSTATTTKTIPTQYQSAMDDADAMNWDVVCSDTSVKLTPPNAKKGDQIVLPLTKPLAPPQLRVTLVDKGFVAAVQAWEREQGKGEPEPQAEEKATAATKPEKPVRVCKYCEEDPEVKKPFSTTHPPALGVHQRHKHGIMGASSEAIRKRGETAAKKAAKKAPAKKTTPAKKAAAVTAPVPAPRAAEPVKKQEPLVNVSGLPVSVAAPLGELLNAISATSGDAADLQKEVGTLRDFRDKVDTLVHDGNQTPLKALAAIQDLVQETKK